MKWWTGLGRRDLVWSTRTPVYRLILALGHLRSHTASIPGRGDAPGHRKVPVRMSVLARPTAVMNGARICAQGAWQRDVPVWRKYRGSLRADLAGT